MPSLGRFVGKIRSAETPFYAFLFRMAKWLLVVRLPIPGLLKPVFRALYHLHFMIRSLVMRTVTFFYREPLFRSRCESCGKNILVTLLPDIDSNTQVFVGDNVSFHGVTKIMSGKAFQNPRLVIGSRVHIGNMVSFTVNREIVIEDGVMIASQCYFADTDSHPTDPAKRVSGHAPSEDKIRPVYIRRNAWIGHACHVLKGVTIGEGAIVAAGSVVVEDAPPFSIVAGNPGKVIARLRDESGNPLG